MAKKARRSTTEDESSPGSSAASSSEDIEETARRKRRRPARRNTSKKKRSYSQGREIIKFLAEVKEEVCKQSQQVAESKEEMSKQLEKLREEMSKQLEKLREEMSKQSKQSKEEMCKQSKQANESKEEICKQLEKVNKQEMRKPLTEILTDLRKQWDLHTNGSSGGDSDAARSQSNQVQPRYRLVFKSGAIDKIDKGQPFDISVALVDGNDQTVENGPLASATIELVIVKAEFNQHNNEYNWSREDFESNIKKGQQGNSATVDVDQSLKSIVSDGRFNLVQGVKCHSGSKIFRNSGNKKVRLGVMVVSPMEERVLEGLSNPFYVRGHDRLRHNNMSNMQRSNITGGPPQLYPGLNITGVQPQLPFLGNTTTPSIEPSSIQGQESWIQQYQVPHLPVMQAMNNQTGQAVVDSIYQVQNGQMPNLQTPVLPNSNQTGEIRLNATTRTQHPFLGNPTMLSSGLNINGEPQLSFPGNTCMLSAESSTSQEQRALMQYQNVPQLPMTAQAATNSQIGTQFITHQILPVRLLWDRSNVEPSKHRWNHFDKLNTSPKEHFGSLSSLASIQKSLLDTRKRSGVLVEPLEPDDSDEERPLRSRRQSKYQLRFVNKVCQAYYTRDQIKADDGNLLMVALFDENNTKITSGPLSSASVEIVALHGDFNVNGQDYWTSEEFSHSVVCPPPGEEAPSVLGGDRTLVLAGGEAFLGDAFFQRTSFCARTAKFKMGVRLLASAQEGTIQEGISEPFRVIDRHVEGLHQTHLPYSDPTSSRGDAVLRVPDPEDKSKNNTPPIMMPLPLILSAASTTAGGSMPKGTRIGVAAKKGVEPTATQCIVKQTAAAATNADQPNLSPTSPTAAAQKVQNHHLQCSLGLKKISAATRSDSSSEPHCPISQASLDSQPRETDDDNDGIKIEKKVIVPSSKRKRARIWDTFTEVKVGCDEVHAQCNYCHQKLSVPTKHGTACLFRHASKCHRKSSELTSDGSNNPGHEKPNYPNRTELPVNRTEIPEPISFDFEFGSST